jgi:hypothetical protein
MLNSTFFFLSKYNKREGLYKGLLPIIDPNRRHDGGEIVNVSKHKVGSGPLNEMVHT